MNRLQADPPKRSWVVPACLAAVVLMGVSLRARLVDVPFERDEGEYAAMAQAILRGEVPYRDAYNMKLPGVFYVYALLLKFRESAGAIRWGMIATTSLSTILICRLGRRWFDPTVGLIAALVFMQVSLSATLLGFTANVEHFLVLPMLAGWLALPEPGERNVRRVVVAGLLFGVAILMKQHAAVFALVAGAWLLCGEIARSGWRAALRSLLVFAPAALAPLAVTVAWLGAQGAFGDFWFWTVVYASQYASDLTLADGWGALLRNGDRILSVEWPMAIAAAIGLMSPLWNRAVRSRGDRMAALTLASVLSICPGLYFRPHYFLLGAPCAALWAAIGISSTARAFLGPGARGTQAAAGAEAGSYSTPRPALCFAIALALTAVSIWTEGDYFFRLTPAQISRVYQGANPFPESLQIARYIREHTTDDDRLGILGSEAQIYFYSGRRPATKFLYVYPLMESQPRALEMQHELMRQIEAAAPRYLVYATGDASWLQQDYSIREIFDWIARYTHEHYRLVGVVDIQTPEVTVFRWDEAATGYQPLSERALFIFARK